MLLKHGEEEILWEYFVAVREITRLCPVAEVSLHDGLTMLSEKRHGKMLAGIWNMDTMNEIRARLHGPTNPAPDISLDLLLGYSVGFNATVARDRIYALLGLVRLRGE